MRTEKMFDIGDIVEWDENGIWASRLSSKKEKYGKGPFEITEVLPFGSTVIYGVKKIGSNHLLQNGIFDHKWFKKVT